MSISILEKKVKANALLLDKEIEALKNDNLNKYVTFNSGEMFFSKDFDTAIKKGDNSFGRDSGFVVRKIRKSIPVFACLAEV